MGFVGKASEKPQIKRETEHKLCNKKFTKVGLYNQNKDEIKLTTTEKFLISGFGRWFVEMCSKKTNRATRSKPVLIVDVHARIAGVMTSLNYRVSFRVGEESNLRARKESNSYLKLFGFLEFGCS